MVGALAAAVSLDTCRFYLHLLLTREGETINSKWFGHHWRKQGIPGVSQPDGRVDF